MKNRLFKVFLLLLLLFAINLGLILEFFYYQRQQRQEGAKEYQKTVLQTRETEGLLVADQCLQQSYDICSLIHEQIRQKLHYRLQEFLLKIEEAGGLSLDSTQKVTWEAQNQVTQIRSSIQVPRLLLGQKELNTISWNINPELSSEMLIRYSILQRMNPQGDMLRIVTSLPASEQLTPQGSFVPAIALNGYSYSLIQNILQHKTYLGKCFIDKKAYLALYAPLLDENKAVIGMLEFALDFEAITADLKPKLRQWNRLGNGKFFLLEDSKRRFNSDESLSPAEKMNSHADDAVTALPISGSLIDQALMISEEGKIVHTTYDGTSSLSEYPHKSVLASLSYFEPWDWIFCVHFQKQELQASPGLNYFLAFIDNASLFFLFLVIGVQALAFALLISFIAVYLNRRANGAKTLFSFLKALVQGEAPADLTKVSLPYDSELVELCQQLKESQQKGAQRLSEYQEALNKAKTTLSQTLSRLGTQIKEEGIFVQSACEQNQNFDETLGVTRQIMINLIDEIDTLLLSFQKWEDQKVYAKEAIQQEKLFYEKFTLSLQELKSCSEDFEQKISGLTPYLHHMRNWGEQCHLLAINANLAATNNQRSEQTFEIIAQEIKKITQENEKVVRDFDQALSLLNQQEQQKLSLFAKLSQEFDDFSALWQQRLSSGSQQENILGENIQKMIDHGKTMNTFPQKLESFASFGEKIQKICQQLDAFQKKQSLELETLLSLQQDIEKSTF